jgi:hypothetical protein
MHSRKTNRTDRETNRPNQNVCGWQIAYGATERKLSLKLYGMVPLAGLEPAFLSELDFESSASTNFTTGA